MLRSKAPRPGAGLSLASLGVCPRRHQAFGGHCLNRPEAVLSRRGTVRLPPADTVGFGPNPSEALRKWFSLARCPARRVSPLLHNVVRNAEALGVVFRVLLQSRVGLR